MKKIGIFMGCFILYACQATSIIPDLEIEYQTDTQKPKQWHESVLAPTGSSIIFKGNHQYHFKVAENIGISRKETEYAMICRTVSEKYSLRWQISHLTGSHNYRTPIDFVTLMQGNYLLFRHRVSDNILWADYLVAGNKLMSQQMALYPESEKIRYHLRKDLEKTSLTIDTHHITLNALENEHPMTLCLGIMRSDLMRWKGAVVPEHTLDVNLDKN